MTYFVWLLVYGALAGAIYALVALTFVVVYKSSRAANFAVGEWTMLGAMLTATGLYLLDGRSDGTIGLLCSMLFAVISMIALAIVFARIAAVPMRMRSPMAMIMLTLGVGAVIRGAGTIVFRGVPATITLPIAADHIDLLGMPWPPERMLSALLAGIAIAAVAWFYQSTRAGLALRAMAASPVAALGSGIDAGRYIALSWVLAGSVAVVAGVLWTAVSGGGFGTMLVGLKVFPIVIIGGLNSIPGCIVGAMVIGIMESLASGYLDPILGSGVSVPLSGMLLLAVLWLRPQGLFGEPPMTRV
jgi:branched-chain amino acid transport system permease protein